MDIFIAYILHLHILQMTYVNITMIIIKTLEVWIKGKYYFIV